MLATSWSALAPDRDDNECDWRVHPFSSPPATAVNELNAGVKR
jgi:hypothetical protein